MITKALRTISIDAWLLCGLLLLGCNRPGRPAPETIEIPNREVEYAALTLRPVSGLLCEGEEPFSGSSITCYPNGQLAERISWWQGKKEGKREKWFEDGTLSFQAFYAAGRLQGKSATWWKNGNQRSESNYVAGVAEGKQRMWYFDGTRYKERNLEQGREVGLQRAWRRNGALYVNYEARNGRNFGLRKSNLCVQLEEEEVVYRSQVEGEDEVDQ